MVGEKREFKTGDFVRCKWDVDSDDGGRENWLPVRLGKCSVGFASVGKLTIRIPKSDRFYSGLRYPDYPVFIRIS